MPARGFVTTAERARAELDELSRQLPSLAELARNAARLPLFVAEYQRWYTRARKLVELLGHDRLEEFESYYLADSKRRAVDDSTYCIQDYILAVVPSFPSNSGMHRAVVLRLTAQVSILQSLESRLEGVFAEIEGEMLADLERSELEAARKVLKVSPRAAGALTAVLLENHFLRVARYHGLKISPAKPTAAKLNDLLKKAGISDDSTWRQCQALLEQQQKILSDKNAEPDAASVDDLISQLAGIVKAVT